MQDERKAEPGYEYLVRRALPPMPGQVVPVAVKRLHPDARVPDHKHEGDAADDVYAPYDFRIPPMSHVSIRLGIAIALPLGWKATLVGRSGLAVQHGLLVGGGLVDEGWTDEISAILVNPGIEAMEFTKGSRIAQIMVEPYYRIDWRETDGELPLRSRAGGKGLGSTGV